MTKYWPSRSVLEATAHHEAGHAVAAWTYGFAIRRVTVVAEGNAAGSALHTNPLHRIHLGTVNLSAKDREGWDAAGATRQLRHR